MPEHTADWDGKLALISGAGGAIGGTLAATLLGAGATVVAFDASADALRAARERWNAGDRVQTVVGNVGETADVTAAFAAAEATGRPLTALAACAGVYNSNTYVEELSDAEWGRVLRVNLRGIFLCCRAAARLMVPRKAGTIATMSSGLGYSGGAGRAPYAASKAGVSAFTRALALELAPHGVRANAVAPGIIDTPMPRTLPGFTEDAVQARLQDNPMGRVATAQDVADLLEFLLGPRSAHITAQVVHINGGGWRP